MDSCHSGAMLRGGNGGEKLRQVPMTELVPESVIRDRSSMPATDKEQARGEGPEAKARPAIKLFDLPGWVATYAAQSFEPTVEKYLPPDDAQAQSHGLLTFTIVKILSESRKNLSYQELIQEIYRYYHGLGRAFPTPLQEGTDLNRQVLGESTIGNRGQLRLSVADDASEKVNAGSLSGLTKRTVLAVFPPVSESDDKSEPLGYVRVESLKPFESGVVPCEFQGHAPVVDLPHGAVCRVAYQDLGAPRLLCSLDESAKRLASDPNLVRSLEEIGSRDDGLVGWTKDSKAADWLLRLEEDRVYLEPAGGTLTTGEQIRPGDAGRVGPTKVDPKLPAWVEDQLRKVARAQFLLKLASEPAFAQGDERPVHVDTRVLHYRNSENQSGQAVDFTSGQPDVSVGDVISLEVKNTSPTTVDVSLLFIDSQRGITCLFPRIGAVEDNRLRSGKQLRTPRFVVNGETAGLEHLVTIAVKAEGAPIDFSFLEQKRLERTRSAEGEPAGLQTPLGQLIKSGMYGLGQTRGLTPADSQNYEVQSLSWRVVP
jgi:hypothetical protein